VDPQKQHLVTIASRVHRAVRKLKKGETGTISCGKDCPVEEAKQYLVAYAYHKQKWFEVRFDSVSAILYAQRIEPPALKTPEEDNDPDEI
jgi:hypothetical protein